MRVKAISFSKILLVLSLLIFSAGCNNNQEVKTVEEILEEANVPYAAILHKTQLSQGEDHFVIVEYDMTPKVYYLTEESGSWQVKAETALMKDPSEQLSWAFQVYKDHQSAEHQVFFGLIWDKKIVRVHVTQENSFSEEASIIETDQEYNLWMLVKEKTDQTQSPFKITGYSKDGNVIKSIP